MPKDAEGDRLGIGARVMGARRRADLTREGLAVRSGLSWSAITQIETGRRQNPRGDTLAALGRALGVSTDYLLGVGADGLTPALLAHHAFFYSGRDDFVETAGPFVAEGIRAGEATLVATTPPNIDALRRRLGKGGRGVRFEASPAFYRSPRAAYLAYRDFCAQALADGAVWLRVVGEPLWGDGSPEDLSRWGRYEVMLNVGFAALPLTLACAHDESSLPPEVLKYARLTHCNTLARGEPVPAAASPRSVELCLSE